MTEPCAPINEGIYKKKKPLTFRDFLVDPEGVEPSSKRGRHTLSTCLSSPEFSCRDKTEATNLYLIL